MSDETQELDCITILMYPIPLLPRTSDHRLCNAVKHHSECRRAGSEGTDQRHSPCRYFRQPP